MRFYLSAVLFTFKNRLVFDLLYMLNKGCNAILLNLLDSFEVVVEVKRIIRHI